MPSNNKKKKNKSTELGLIVFGIILAVALICTVILFSALATSYEGLPESKEAFYSTVPATAITEATSAPKSEKPVETTEEPVDISTPVADYTINPWINLDESLKCVLPLTDDAGLGYQNKIVFIGDSTTYGLMVYGMLYDGTDTTQVWVPTNGTLTLAGAVDTKIYYPDSGTEITMGEAAKLKKPEYVVITLGVNGVSFMNEESFHSEYGKVIESIKKNSPDTKIILQSIYPVCASYEHQDSINNDKIKAADAWIADIAEENGCKYLNTASALVGTDGYLPETLQNGDGLHLNPDGYNIVLSYIRTHAYK